MQYVPTIYMYIIFKVQVHIFSTINWYTQSEMQSTDSDCLLIYSKNLFINLIVPNLLDSVQTLVSMNLILYNC
jgi:hypothetical protein